MNYTFSETSFPSVDGKHTVYAEIYIPKDREPVGIVQLAHGMVDYVGRYTALADFLTEKGYIFAGNHHLGHGKSVTDESDYGFFGESEGYKFVIDDMYSMNEYLRKTYPGLPLIVMGHSMGSFITRLYTVKYPDSMSGVIIHGTGGKNPALPLGKFVTKLLMTFKGPRKRSDLIENLAFGAYNSHFPKSEGKNAWLTRDIQSVSGRDDDKYTNFKFTLSGYYDLFTMLGECNKQAWFDNYPKKLPTLVISGDADPVGNYGKGPRQVYARLGEAGCEKLTLKMYEGARHELFNEINKDEVFADILSWIEGL